MTAEPAIQISGLHKRFGRGGRAVKALDGVDLTVERGSIHGLLGRNGAGKTTIVKILLGLVQRDRGSANVLGKDPRDHRSRTRIGFLPEDHRFPPHHTARSYMHFQAGLAGLSREDSRKRTNERLELVGLSSAMDRRIKGFSKGMKQRLGLAQALLADPELLFLDEPTDGVDPVGRSKIRDLLEQLRDSGVTIFLNSHLLGEVEQVCDNVTIMERGKIVKEGRTDELTEVSMVYRLRTEPPVLPDLLDEFRARGVEIDRLTDGAVEMRLPEISELDRCIDRLRDQSIGVRELVGKRESLESVFLGAVGESKATGRANDDDDNQEEDV